MYKKLLDNLKSSANRDRDEYPWMSIDTFNLFVRECGQYDTVKPHNPRANNRGGDGHKGRERSNFPLYRVIEVVVDVEKIEEASIELTITIATKQYQGMIENQGIYLLF